MLPRTRRALIAHLKKELKLDYVPLGSGQEGVFFTITWNGLSANNPQNARPLYRVWLCAGGTERIDPDEALNDRAYDLFAALENYEPARMLFPMSSGQPFAIASDYAVWAAFIDIEVEPK